MTRLPTIFALTLIIPLTGATLTAQEGGVPDTPTPGTRGTPIPTQSSGPKVIRVGEDPNLAQAGQLGISRGSQLIGRSLFDANGRQLGEINDLVIDSTGRITAVVSRSSGGGFFGVPLSSLTPQLEIRAGADTGRAAGGNEQTAVVDRFVFSGDENLLRSAPVLQDSSQVSDAWAVATSRHFGVLPTTGSGQAGQAGQAGQGAPLGQTGSAEQARRAMGFQSLMQRRVNTASGDNLAIRDLAIDLRTGSTPFVIVGRPGTGATAESLHGIGLESFNFTDPTVARLDVDSATLDRSPVIEMGRLPSQPSVQLTGRTPRATTPAGQTPAGGQPRSGQSGTTPRGENTTPKPGEGTTPRDSTPKPSGGGSSPR